MSEQQQQQTASYEDCDHDYEFVESLPSDSEAFQELWTCIHCKHEIVLTHYTGIRD
ncbi:MAG: hypothetical protein ACJ71P_11850 [Nitrososphaeraceae archaeon]|jgi:hypothetical protein